MMDLINKIMLMILLAATITMVLNTTVLITTATSVVRQAVLADTLGKMFK